MKQGLEVRMEGLGGLGIVIQGDGAGGTLDYQGQPWEEVLHPPVSKAGDRRQCPLQWHRQATESRWGSSSFKAHQRAAPGQQEDKPTLWSPGKLQLG